MACTVSLAMVNYGPRDALRQTFCLRNFRVIVSHCPFHFSRRSLSFFPKNCRKALNVSFLYLRYFFQVSSPNLFDNLSYLITIGMEVGIGDVNGRFLRIVHAHHIAAIHAGVRHEALFIVPLACELIGAGITCRRVKRNTGITSSVQATTLTSLLRVFPSAKCKMVHRARRTRYRHYLQRRHQ